MPLVDVEMHGRVLGTQGKHRGFDAIAKFEDMLFQKNPREKVMTNEGGVCIYRI